MAIEIKIPASDLTGFSDPARARLTTAAEEYVVSLIEEANRIEAGRKTGNGPLEITHGMVSDAVIVQRQGLGNSKKSALSKILRVVSAALSLAAGIMFDPQLLQNQTYLVVFVLIIAAAILTMTISIMRE